MNSDLKKIVLIVGHDSDIAKQIAAIYRTNGDIVKTTSRNGAGDYHVEIAHPSSWPKFQEKYDLVYYCIGMGDARASRAEVMQINCFMTMDFLSFLTPSVLSGGKIVVMSTVWGSVKHVSELTRPVALQGVAYKLSRAAMNMGVAILSQRFKEFGWILMHPGAVRTKATKRLTIPDMITPQDSANGVVKVVEAAVASRRFQFVDYTGKEREF